MPGLQLSCRLVRGDYEDDRGAGGHAWNVVRCDHSWWLCDVMHRPGSLYPIDSDKAMHYKRLEFGKIDAHGGGVGAESIPLAPGLGMQESDPHFVPRDALELGDILGKGGFGVVRKAIWKRYASLQVNGVLHTQLRFSPAQIIAF